jgi:hypothetical protein
MPSLLKELQISVSPLPKRDRRGTIRGSADTYSVRKADRPVRGQLPPLIRFRDDDVEVDFASALMLENVNVQPAATVMAYFEGPAAREVMPAVTIATGAVATNLSCLCPIPLAWAPYFIAAGAVAANLSCLCPIPMAWAPYFLDFKNPYEAYRMGTRLIGTMTTDAERLRVGPLLIWLCAYTPQRQGAPRHNRV